MEKINYEKIEAVKVGVQATNIEEGRTSALKTEEDNQRSSGSSEIERKRPKGQEFLNEGEKYKEASQLITGVSKTKAAMLSSINEVNQSNNLDSSEERLTADIAESNKGEGNKQAEIEKSRSEAVVPSLREGDSTECSRQLQTEKMEKINYEKIETEEVEMKEVNMEKEKADLEEAKLQELIPESLEKNKDSLTNSSPLATVENTAETVSPALKTGGEKQESSGSSETGQKRSEDEEFLKEGERHEEFRQLTTVESGVEVEEKQIADALESNRDKKSNEQLSEAGVPALEADKTPEISGPSIAEQARSEVVALSSAGDKTSEASVSCIGNNSKGSSDLSETSLASELVESVIVAESSKSKSIPLRLETSSECIVELSSKEEIRESVNVDDSNPSSSIPSETKNTPDPAESLENGKTPVISDPRIAEQSRSENVASSSEGNKRPTTNRSSGNSSNVSSDLLEKALLSHVVESVDVDNNNKSIPSRTKNTSESTESSSNQINSTKKKFGSIRIREDLLLEKPLNIKIKTEGQNVSALQEGKQPPKKATTKKQRQIARRRLRAMCATQNLQMNAGNLPENPAILGSHGNLSGNNAASEKNQVIWPKQETSLGEEMRGHQVISSGSKAIPKQKKKKLSINQGNMTTNETNLPSVQRKPFRNQENRSWYPQLPLQNPGNSVAQPSTSSGEISHNCAENFSGKRKRKFKDLSSRNAQNFKRPRHSERDLPSNNKNPELTRVIITEDYWRVGITRIELGLISNTISQEIDRIQEGPIPRFNKSFLKSGGIVVESADLWSREWLTYMIPRLNPLNGTFLRVVGLESLEKFYKAVMWVPGMIENPESTLKRLERQNSTLKTEVWRIYSVNEEFTPNGYELSLGIPQSSVQVLQEINFRPYLGLSRVSIYVNGFTDS